MNAAVTGRDPRGGLAAWATALALALALAAPAARAAESSGPAGKAVASVPSKADPWERLNRGVFAFNDLLDDVLLVPVAKAYKAVLPGFVRAGVDNVFGNVADAWSTANHLLQGKGRSATEMTVRVVTNSVFGFGGLLDVASEMGLERESEDLGQTLGRWGFGPGPYMVLPFFGPSSVRDTAGLPLDRTFTLSGVAHGGAQRWGLTTLEFVHGRAELLETSRLLNQIALDRYSFVRDSYLARRRNQVFDGNPPEEADEDLPEAPAAARP